MLLSTLASPAFAAGDLVPANSYLDVVRGLTYVGAGATVFGNIAGNWLYDKVMRWGGGSGTTVSDNSAEFNYKSNNNFSHVTNTGAKNNYIYNNSYSSTSKTTNNYQVLNTTNKTFYDITHNTYQTYNNITYNQQYNTYKIDYTYNNYNYNTYITNNNTYVSYYIVNNDKSDDDTYAEVYLVLPDGRSAYGLKATDVWGQYFNYNVSGAQRVAEDDGTTLGLWHLDGNFTNSAYSQTINPIFGSTDFRVVDDVWGSGLNVSEFGIDVGGDIKTVEFRAYLSEDSRYRIPVKDTCLVDVSNLEYHDLFTSNDGKTHDYHYPYYLSRDKNTSAVTAFKSKMYTIPGNGWHSVAFVLSDDVYGFYLDGINLQSKFESDDEIYLYYYDTYRNKWDGVWWKYSELKAKGCLSHQGYSVPTSDSSPVTGVLDELRYSNKVLYTSNYNPALAPFDTNLVQVRPANPMDGDIVVYSDGVEISDHRIGGVRPTFPTTGFAWLNITDKYTCDSVQVYNGSSWVSSSADIYYQGSWYSVKDFDFEKCCYLQKTDSGGSGSGGSGSGDSGGSGSGGGGSGGSGSGDTDISDSSLWNKLFGALASAVGAVFKGLLTVLATFAEGFASVVSTLTNLFVSLVNLGGDFSDFLGVFFSWLPPEIVGLLSLSVTLGIVMAVIRFFWK